MARNKSLLSLLRDLRIEIRASGNPAHNSGARDAQVAALQHAQEEEWEATDWPFLRVERFIDLQAGQYVYDTPDDMPLERVEIEVGRPGPGLLSRQQADARVHAAGRLKHGAAVSAGGDNCGLNASISKRMDQRVRGILEEQSVNLPILSGPWQGFLKLADIVDTELAFLRES